MFKYKKKTAAMLKKLVDVDHGSENCSEPLLEIIILRICSE
jgi:hypothetical protein